jgi:hypothetical protein
MTTGAGPKKYPSDVGVHALRVTVEYNDANVDTGILIGELPEGAFVLPATVHVQTAFNAATTNVLVLGSSADDDGFVTSSDAAAGTAGVKKSLSGALSGVVSANTKVYVKYTQSGTAASAGKATIVLPFYPDYVN